jgi:hypothetical protein
MAAQPEPAVSQRSHAYVNVIGVSPAQLPLDAVSAWPIWAVPETVGDVTFDGATAERASPAMEGVTPTVRTTAATSRKVFMQPLYGGRWTDPLRLTEALPGFTPFYANRR